MSRENSRRGRQEAGFTLIATGVCLIALVGMLGLAVDLGRLYITKNEAQAFADAGALAAAKKLNGTAAGITAAKAAVVATYPLNRWNMGSTSFSASNTTVEFGTTMAGPWEGTPAAAAGVAFTRVTATPNLGLSFIAAVRGPQSQSVSARSTAGIIPATFSKGGYLPFRVVAHSLGDANFGLQVGQEYTIRWPANAKPGNDTCKGDNSQQWIENAGAGGSSERGYFELQSAAAIRAAILGQRQLIPLSVGDILNMANGNKNTERDALEALAGRDTDQTQYQAVNNGVMPAYAGNGSRLVILPISARATGYPAAVPAIAGDQVLTFGAFLLPMTHDRGGNKSWCAIYMGAKNVGSEGVSAFMMAGAFATRLVQ